jgi:hypothetical protein
MNDAKTDADTAHDSKAKSSTLNRIIKRFGGRHLIFRTQLQKNWRVLPRSYGLVSDFCGPVWFFYGLGQIWVTHKKYRQYDGWTARVPRIGGAKIVKLLDSLESAITEFTHHCNTNGIEGTLVLEPEVIEFHWTFGYSLEKEKMKPEECGLLDSDFEKLVDAFLIAKESL